MNNETKLLGVASSPHVSSPIGTRTLMLDVLVALVPSLCVAVFFFGLRALIATAISVAACEVFEWGYRKLLHKTNTNGDLSAAVTGVLLAFVCPVTLPYWMLIIGDFFAIVVVKQLFGGIGQNFVNPAITGRIILMVSFPTAMTTWINPRSWLDKGAEAVTTATPLTMMTKGGELSDGLPSLVDMLIGIRGGSLGETCAVALIIGGIYMMIRKIISPAIPLSFIGTVAVIMLIAGKGDFRFVAYQLLSGGLMLGAFFMATDYTTSPINFKGRIIFGIGCGLLTCFIRRFGSYPEGVCYSILIMNCTTWLLDKYIRPTIYGAVKKEKKEKKEATK